MKQPISTWDIFYISYDEPQKEEFWAKLQDLAPWAKRIDGVKGFDSAHKACAQQSETDRFITVDGDTIVYPEFFDLELNIPDSLKDCTLSWASKNEVNGLCYGNGCLKLWAKDFALNMRTHENAVHDEEKVDFCWADKHVRLNKTYSTTYINGSPFQAFRAGFREGIKMTLNCGHKAEGGVIKNHVRDINFKRLLIWSSVGADVENGIWSIYGARLGIYMANIKSDFDISHISDYEWFKNYFYNDIAPFFPGNKKCARTGQMWDERKLLTASKELLTPLQKDLGLEIADLNAEQSKFFKTLYDAPKMNNNPKNRNRNRNE